MNSPEKGKLVMKHDQVGAAVIYNMDGSFKILVNDVDHLEIIYRRDKTSIPNAVEDFHKMLKQLDNLLKFAFDDVLGYVTARPYDLGLIGIEIKVELKDLHLMS
jgi:protein-arginine kinase